MRPLHGCRTGFYFFISPHGYLCEVTVLSMTPRDAIQAFAEGEKVSKRKSVKVKVHLTERTLRALVSIEEFSIANWGKRVTSRYVDDIEAALQRLSEKSEVLREEPNYHECLYFYRVNKHLLVCDLQRDSVFVLTVLPANMDIRNRLAELELTLEVEAEMLSQQLGRGRTCVAAGPSS